jgi:hypothetical protein
MIGYTGHRADDQHRPLYSLGNQSHVIVVQEGLSQQSILFISITILQHNEHDVCFHLPGREN